MSEAITLGEARDRVTAVTGAARSPWTFEDVLWVSRHWGIFSNELRQCRDLEEEIMELELHSTPAWVLLYRGLRAGALWWLRDSPALARMGLAALGLFVYAFALGRF